MAGDNELRISTYLDLVGLDAGLSEVNNKIQAANDKLISSQKAAGDAASESLKSSTSWIEERSNQILNITTAIVAQMKEEGAAVAEIKAQLDQMGYSAGQVDKAFANYKEQLALANVEAQKLEAEQERMARLSAASAEGFAALASAPPDSTRNAGVSNAPTAYNEAAAAQYLALAGAENTATDATQRLTEATAAENEEVQAAQGTWADFIATEEAASASSQATAGAMAAEGVAVQNTRDMWNQLYASEDAEVAVKGRQVAASNRMVSANSELRTSIRETSEAGEQAAEFDAAAHERRMKEINERKAAELGAAAVQKEAINSVSQEEAKAGTVAYALAQNAQTAAGQVAQAFLRSGASAKDLGEDLKEMGFKAEQIAAALNELGFTAEQTGEKVKYSFLQARGAATLATDILVGGGPTSMAYGIGRLLASSQLLGPVLQAAFPVIGALAFIDILTQIPDKINEIIDKLSGWDKEAERVFKKEESEVKGLIGFYDRIIERQVEAAGRLAEAGGATKSGALAAQIQQLGIYQGDIAKTQQMLQNFMNVIDDVGTHTQTVIKQTEVGPIAYDTPLFNTEKGKKALQEQEAIFQKYLDDIADKTHQSRVVLPPIDQGQSDKKIKELLEARKDMLKELERGAEEKQFEESQKATDKRLDQQRAETEEFVKNKMRELADFERVENTKTSELNKDSQQRIAIAQSEVNKAQEIYGAIASRKGATPDQIQAAADAVIRAKQHEAEVERQVDDAMFETFKSTMEAQVQVSEQSADEEVRNLQHTFSQALGLYGSQSDKVKEVYNQMVNDRRAASNQEIFDLMRVYGQAVRQYGAESKQAQDAMKAVVEARKKGVDEQIKLEQNLAHAIAQRQVLEIGMAGRAAALDVQREAQATEFYSKELDRRMAAEMKWDEKHGALGAARFLREYNQLQANLDAEENARRASLDREYQMEVDTLKRQMAVRGLDEKDYEALLKRKLALDQKYQQDRQKLEEQYSQRRRQLQDQEVKYKERLEQQFVNMWSREWDRMLWQAKSVSEALTMLWQDMVRMIIDAIIKWVGVWIAEHLIMLAFGQDATQKTKDQNAQEAMSDAAVAADATLAWWSAVNPPIAPAMAAAQYGIGMMYAGLAAFEKGGNVPGDMLAYLHADEMVLPADIASSVRAMSAAGMAGGMKGGTTSALSGSFERLNLSMSNWGAVASQSQPLRGMDHPHSGRPPDVHFHNAPVIQALDATSFDRVLKRHQATFTRNMLHSLRNGRVNINKLLRGR